MRTRVIQHHLRNVPDHRQNTRGRKTIPRHRSLALGSTRPSSIRGSPFAIHNRKTSGASCHSVGAPTTRASYIPPTPRPCGRTSSSTVTTRRFRRRIGISCRPPTRRSSGWRPRSGPHRHLRPSHPLSDIGLVGRRRNGRER